MRRVLDASSGGRIRGLLTAESEAVFRRFVASALSQGFELEDFEAFAQLVAAGRATWWRSSWSLALLVKNDAHGLVMGLERGRAWRLEQRARKKAPPPATRGGEPQSLGDVEQLRAFIAGAGLSKAGGT
ncbi:MAG: hypothetical protein EKK55_02385 [Rhodocyclaceae bacterium]|nr:MAG: hypothetical protein EKK55_02385 [Rhodocyclaceae bacterium]